MEALLKNKTWIFVNLPKGQKTVGCKWVFSIKYKVDGTIERYKARLVAKGFTQTYGVDYQETFSPVAKLNTVRVLLSLAANLDWPLHQFDVKNAFLHGDLEEDIYMDIPSGYVANTEGNIVCKLQRTLYGLKQSPRAWFGRFSTTMKKYGFQQSNSDHTLFLKHRQGKLTTLIVYVDDMIITGDDSKEIARLQEQLASEFEMKNLGGLKYFLGIEVARSKRGIFLSQRKYILDLLTKVGLLDCKPTETPIIPNHKLGEYPNQVPTDKGRYQRLVGKLIYLSHTRPDIAYAVSVVSQFMHCPSENHMSAVMQILRYLKSSPGKGLRFSKNDHLRVEGYTDADWAGNIMDRKSTSGYFTFVGGNLVTWRSKKQKVVALSSAEAEFRGMAKGLCELLWLRRLLTEIGFAPDSEMKLFCDNKAAIDISHNPIQHDRTKHVEVDRHFIKQNLDAKIIQFPFVKSEDQLADILTKAVSSKIFHHSLDKLGLIDIYVPT
ncbi:Retrovirus-related Pol polyprotein from transposon RE1 [Vitis vinifera]|uniref:Retrovirus-related Pol polyprotein from transposon RE1 n=1 Tax=Vitis vinifera TaxID=29760 RepID=A0A438HDV0_VITVI|nr:Retrovirus-related Pol polyprotein from transposon RE1 [Vitis vinifera]